MSNSKEINNEKSTELFKRAVVEFNNNNFDEAKKIFEEISNLENIDEKTRIESMQNIGVIYSKMSDVECNKLAIEQFDNALKCTYKKIKEYNNREYKDDEYNKLIMIEMSLVNNKIASLFKLKDYNYIIDYIDKYLIDKKIENISYKKLDYSQRRFFSDIYLYKGIAEYHINNYDDAIKSNEESIKLYPYNVKVYNNQAFIYQTKGNHYEAIKYSTYAFEFEKEEEFKIYVQILNSGNSFGFTIKTKYQCIIFDFLSIFSKLDYSSLEINFTSTVQMSEELIIKIREFVSKYSIDNDSKKILSGIVQRFNEIELNHYFCILPGIDKVDTNQYFYTMMHLMKESGQTSLENIESYEKDFNDIFSASLSLYNINFTKNEYNKPYKGKGKNKKTHNKFICKYCGKEYDDIESRAHIIPESLGGNIIDEEECKECNNNKFSKTIEVDLNQYLAPWKTIYGIKGKDKIPSFERNNGSFIRFVEKDKLDKKDKLEIGSKNIELDKNGMPKKIGFDIGKINMQNLYRAFVKMSIGYIEGKIVSRDFSETIKFINGELKDQKLPPIITYFNPYVIPKYNNENNNVFLNLFYRKENTSKEFPYLVSEFIFYNFSFIYIVPFSKEDIYDFSENEHFEYFHKHWHSYKFNYALINCNIDEDVNLYFNINLLQNNKI
ncbi:hypothetical protein SZ52_12695 [Brachyspira hyodysenteriae]|uniref:HNH endonuclease n=1 Tax=Brachyspira hyodysenteriae TaxID=159 RepID=UPI00063DBC83|nr:HNH endonuclease [Brachyspira hyodysenteriae]KLI38414.1 hypothetical protein SZ52_12695 [Brachyspira hyodysenteriae]